MLGLGMDAYFDEGAPERFRRIYANSFGLPGRAVIVMLSPAGLGFVLMGAAFMLGKNVVTSNMLILGFGLVVLGWLVFFIHPKVILPKWLRDDGWMNAPHVNRH